jgi:hypothetical protein
MCPACIESAVLVVAGAGSTAGILAVSIGELRKLLRSSVFGLFQKTRDMTNVQLHSAVLREGTIR